LLFKVVPEFKSSEMFSFIGIKRKHSLRFNLIFKKIKYIRVKSLSVRLVLDIIKNYKKTALTKESIIG